MSLRARVISLILVVLGTVFAAYPSFFSDEQRRASPWIPDSGITLGLDLQGGIHWVLSIDTEKAIEQELERVRKVLTEQAQEQGFAVGEIQLSGRGELELRGADTARVQALLAEDFPTVRAELRDGVLALGLTDDWREAVVERGVRQALDVLRRRVDGLGVREPVIAPQGDDRILVQMPGQVDPAEARKMISRTTFLQFKQVIDAADNQELLRARHAEIPEDQEIALSHGPDGSVREAYLVPKTEILTGAMLEDARLTFGNRNEPIVSFTWNGEGTQLFREFTAANVGQRLAAVLDGEVITAPVIRSRIGRDGVIEGRFTQDEAANLAVALRSGALPIPLVIEEERAVGPALGADSIRQGVTASLVGSAIVILFMVFYYSASGAIADIALVVNLLMILALMGAFEATLTLPGMAGLVLTVGMAVDANVLIFERIREELRAGKALRAAVQQGFARSSLTILDANLTTMIAAVILYYLGSGPVQGFGVTLGIGIVTSVFCALYVSKVLADLWVARTGKLQVFARQIIRPDTRIDFVSQARLLGTISLVFCLATVVLILWRGLNLGVEFAGGTLVQIQVPEQAGEIDEGRLREAVGAAGFPSDQVVRFGAAEERSFQIKLRESEAGTQGLGQAVVEGVSRELGTPVALERTESIGPVVGAEMRRDAIWAMAIAWALILLYIWFRFDLLYAPGAVIALVHDVLVTVGVFALFGLEFNLQVLAALLVIIGFSINDTIVIYDRIRENLEARGRVHLEDVVNQSVNQTLSRTLLTSLTVLAVVLALLFFGGPVIRDFALAMTIGVISGVYSTVYVASALLIFLEKRWGGAAERRAARA